MTYFIYYCHWREITVQAGDSLTSISNPDKFPPDFAFQLSDEELRSQNATAISPMSRYNPWAYTLEGINQSANILNSPEANRRSVQIIRIFSDLERMAHGEEPKDDRMWTVIQR